MAEPATSAPWPGLRGANNLFHRVSLSFLSWATTHRGCEYLQIFEREVPGLELDVPFPIIPAVRFGSARVNSSKVYLTHFPFPLLWLGCVATLISDGHVISGGGVMDIQCISTTQIFLPPLPPPFPLPV